MSKESIKVTIQNSENINKIKTIAIIQENIIKYKEDENTIVKFNYNSYELIRENDELRMSYIFCDKKNTQGKIFVKSLNKELSLEIKTKRIKKNNYNIEIEFTVENNDFLYKIEVLK